MIEEVFGWSFAVMLLLAFCFACSLRRKTDAPGSGFWSELWNSGFWDEWYGQWLLGAGCVLGLAGSIGLILLGLS